MVYQPIDSVKGSSDQALGVLRVIEAIGKDNFMSQLMLAVRATCGAEHCSIVQFADKDVVEVAAGSSAEADSRLGRLERRAQARRWLSPAALAEACKHLERIGSSSIRIGVSRFADVKLREPSVSWTRFRERILLCGGSPDIGLGLSILSSTERAAFSQQELSQLCEVAPTLFSAIIRHVDPVTSRRAAIRRSFIASANRCVHIRLSECTFQTGGCCVRPHRLRDVDCWNCIGYRRRQRNGHDLSQARFCKLGIGSRRELLFWYLNLARRESKYTPPRLQEQAFAWEC